MLALRTLIVEDDADGAGRLAAALEGELGPVAVAGDAYRALDRLQAECFDVVLTEIVLPGASGIDLLERLESDVAAVVLTWLMSPAVVARAQAAGARAVLGKPCSPARIVPVLRGAAEAARRGIVAGQARVVPV